MPEASVPGIGAGIRRRDRESNAALAGELERVREEILDHLLEAFGVGEDRRGQRGIQVDRELQAPRLGHVAEGALHVAV